jgi:hypothetical protein
VTELDFMRNVELATCTAWNTGALGFFASLSVAARRREV